LLLMSLPRRCRVAATPCAAKATVIRALIDRWRGRLARRRRLLIPSSISTLLLLEGLMMWLATTSRVVAMWCLSHRTRTWHGVSSSARLAKLPECIDEAFRRECMRGSDVNVLPKLVAQFVRTPNLAVCHPTRDEDNDPLPLIPRVGPTAALTPIQAIAASSPSTRATDTSTSRWPAFRRPRRLGTPQTVWLRSPTWPRGG